VIRNRMKVAVFKLRSLGLASVLLGDRSGYRLDPRVRFLTGYLAQAGEAPSRPAIPPPRPTQTRIDEA
jgi:hypothetical protein